MAESISQISFRIGNIREFINIPRRQHALMLERAQWLRLCSSLDVVEDTESAIEAFTASEFSATKRGSYLAIYGLLQVLYVQQDAIGHLCKSLGIAHDTKNYPRLDEIRQIRNDSIGHPTNRRKGTSFSFISQPLLGPRGFELVILYTDGRTESKSALFSNLIDDQRQIIRV